MLVKPALLHRSLAMAASRVEMSNEEQVGLFLELTDLRHGPWAMEQARKSIELFKKAEGNRMAQITASSQACHLINGS